MKASNMSAMAGMEAPSVGKNLTKAVSRKFRPKISYKAHVMMPREPMEDMAKPSTSKPGSWRKREMARLQKEIDALQHEHDNFDDKKAATDAKKSLKSKIDVKTLRLKEHQLKCDDGEDDGYMSDYD